MEDSKRKRGPPEKSQRFVKCMGADSSAGGRERTAVGNVQDNYFCEGSCSRGSQSLSLETRRIFERQFNGRIHLKPDRGLRASATDVESGLSLLKIPKMLRTWIDKLFGAFWEQPGLRRRIGLRCSGREMEF